MSDFDSPNTILAHNRAALLDALRVAGAASAVVAYSGYGGVTNPNQIRVLDNKSNALTGGQPVAVLQEISRGVDEHRSNVIVDSSLRDALDAFATLAVRIHHPQYEKDEGGTGEVIFDCADSSVRMEHRDFRIEYVHSETDL